MRQYSTHPKNFIGKPWQQEKLYTPDEQLVKTLHRLLDTIKDDNIALAIDMVVADLMRCEGYGQPQRYQELVNAYILGEVMELIGADECFVESTNKPTEQLNKFGSYIKGQNELRQELRNKANKKWGK